MRSCQASPPAGCSAAVPVAEVRQEEALDLGQLGDLGGRQVIAHGDLVAIGGEPIEPGPSHPHASARMARFRVIERLTLLGRDARLKVDARHLRQQREVPEGGTEAMGLEVDVGMRSRPGWP